MSENELSASARTISADEVADTWDSMDGNFGAFAWKEFQLLGQADAEELVTLAQAFYDKGFEEAAARPTDTADAADTSDAADAAPGPDPARVYLSAALPKLPKGYFWHVNPRSSAPGCGILEAQLWAPPVSGIICRSHFQLGQSAHETAIHVLNRAEGMVGVVEQHAAVEALAGSYGREEL